MHGKSTGLARAFLCSGMVVDDGNFRHAFPDFVGDARELCNDFGGVGDFAALGAYLRGDVFHDENTAVKVEHEGGEFVFKFSFAEETTFVHAFTSFL